MGIFDKLTTTLNNAGESASQKAKTLADLTKEYRRQDELKKQAEELTAEIGRYVIANPPEEPSEELKAMLDKIAETDAQMQSSRARVMTLKGKVVCQSCGNEIACGIKFCNFCGAKVEYPEAEPEAAEPLQPGYFCPSCGSPVMPGEFFCSECGAKLSIPATEENEITTDNEEIK